MYHINTSVDRLHWSRLNVGSDGMRWSMPIDHLLLPHKHRLKAERIVSLDFSRVFRKRPTGSRITAHSGEVCCKTRFLGVIRSPGDNRAATVSPSIKSASGTPPQATLIFLDNPVFGSALFCLHEQKPGSRLQERRRNQQWLRKTIQ